MGHLFLSARFLWHLILAGLVAVAALPNASYAFQDCEIRSADGDVEGFRTEFVFCDEPGLPPPVPNPFNVPSSDSDGNYTISWGASSGATRYILYESPNNSSWTVIYNGSSRSRNISGKTSGYWYYRVRACNAYFDCSMYTPTKSVYVSTPPPPTPATFSVPSSDTNGAFTVSWSSSSGATRYELWQKLNSGSWSRIQNSSSTSRAITGRTNGTWYYRVRACNTAGCSNYTATKGVVVLLPPPVPGSFSVPSSDTDGAFTISWGAASTATRYELWQRLGSGSWSRIQNSSARSRAISGLTDGTWSYRVRACNTSGCGSYTAIKSVVVDIPPPIPPAPTISGPSSDSDGSYRLTWGEQSSTDTHKMQRRFNSGSWSSEISRTVPYFDESTTQEGTWRYRVRSCNETGCSSYSSVKSVVVDFPPPVAATPPAPAPFADPGPSATSDQIGTTEGSFRVDESGAATYSIPISAADGTAGVKPSISMQYSSGAANGIAGIGWKIGGLSLVSRCRQTLDQDKNPEPITFSSTDRYCLDGQRLVLETGTTYGAANSTYRTEIESGAIVTIRGNSSGEPDYFEVRRKDGSTSYYGRTPANSGGYAKLTKGAGKTLNWGIRQFKDSVGNSIWFDYENSSNSLRIQHVKYAFGSSAGPSGYNARVTFVYSSTARPDPISGYVGGYKFTSDRLLTNIRSYNRINGSEQLIRDYVLRYNENQSVSTDELSRLTSVQECANGRCLPKTTFDWRLPLATAPLRQIAYKSLAESNNISDFTLADINGDGRMDMAWLEGSTNSPSLNYALFDGTQYVQTAFTSGSLEFRITSGAESLKPIDFNLDGRQDLAFWSESSQRWRVILSAPQAYGKWKLETMIYSTPITEEKVSFADVDGNGTTDAVWSTSSGGGSGQIYVSLLKPVQNLPTTSSAYYRFQTPIQVSNGSSYSRGGVRAVAADFNGDGRVGIVTGYANTWCYEDGVIPYSTPKPGERGLDSVSAGDAPSIQLVDCDGIKQASAVNIVDAKTGTPAAQRYSNLNVQGPIDNWSQHVHVKDLVVTDANGDGLSDLFYPVYHDGDGEVNRFYFAINKGDGSFDVQSIYSSTIHASDVRRPQFVDWNGDGYQDLLWKETSGSAEVWVRYFDPVTNRLGSTSRVMYVSSTLNESVFFPDVNGDSIPDVLRIDTSSGAGVVRVYTRKSGSTVVNQAMNRIERITNGIGGVTEIEYEPLSTTDHYDRLEINTIGGTEQVCEQELNIEFCWDAPVQVADADSFYGKINGGWDLPASAQSLGKNSPILEMNGPYYVVTRVLGSAPTAGAVPNQVNTAANSSVTYRYGEAKIQAAGRGFLGFERLISIDDQTGIETTTRYRQDWPFTGRPISTTTKSASGHLLSSAVSSWTINEWYSGMPGNYAANGSNALGPIHVIQDTTEETTYDLVGVNGTSQGDPIAKIETDTDYDSEGNATRTIVATRSGAGTLIKRVTTVNTYDSTTFSRFEGRLSGATVTTYRQGQTPDLVRQSRFTYYTSGALRGLLKDKIVEPYDSAFTKTTTNSYDAFGNRVRAKVAGGGVTRCNVETVTFDSIGRYVTAERDCLGRVTSTITARNSFGLATAAETYVSASASTTSRTSYGALGRAYYSWDEAGASSTTYLSASTANCPAGTVYKSTETIAGGGQAQKCLDIVGRTIRELSIAFDGTWNAVDTEFDSLGRVRRKSEPFNLTYDGPTAPYWTRMEYDVLGRVIEITLPDASSSSVAYIGLTKTTTNDKGQSKTEENNALGEIVRTVDGLGGVNLLVYDHLGNLVSMEDNAGNRTLIGYDKLGRKVWSDDPSLGRWDYDYNHFGELTLQTDAKGQTVSMTYDGLGRMKTRIDRTASGSVESNTEWFYDTSANGLGQIDYVQDSISGFHKAHLYDGLGRVDETITSFDNRSYYEKQTYDQYGRAFQYFDATGNYSFSDSGVANRYNGFGHLDRIADAFEINGVPRTIYQQVEAKNARGKVTVEKRGIAYGSSQAAATVSYTYSPSTGRISDIYAINRNNQEIQDLDYFWDTVGNLTSRREYSGAKNLQETFGYDELNRLTSYTVGSNTVNVTYDPMKLGNILRKSDVAGDYQYGANGAGPYAVSRFNGSNYHYDANGNNTSGGGRTIEYTAFNKAKRIDKGGHRTEFAYAPSRDRYRRVDSGVDGVTIKHYIGSVEIIDLPSGDQHRKRYIGGVAVETIVYRGGNQLSRTVNYLFKDHLGSLDVITDSSGTIVQDMSFDPWGKRRSGVDWTALSGTQLTAFDSSTTTRGYTGHEMLDRVGIIHMNGRIYDPHMARFLQADTYVQNPTHSQSLNRYSYVWNNPLNATDPSGHFLNFLIGALVGAVVGIIGRELDIPLLSSIGNIITCASTGGIGCAAGFAFGATLGMGGSFMDALKNSVFAGMSAAAFSAIGDAFSASSGFFETGGWGHIGAHAVTGGVLSVMQGGKFGHGFLSAGVAKFANANRVFGTSADAKFARIAFAGAVGGTVSEITGGKFANGAITAAFAQAYNGERQAAQVEEQRREYGKKVFAMLERERQRQIAARQRAYDRQWEEDMRWSSWEVAGEVLVDSLFENLNIDLGIEAANGAGVVAKGSTNLNGDTSYDVALTKGVVLKPIGGLSAEVINSSGEIRGFYQSLEFCMIGCINYSWNYQTISIGVAIGPYLGGGFTTGVVNDF